MRKTVTQYRVELADEPGALARLERLLRRERVDLDSAVRARWDGRASVQFLAAPSARLRRKLEETGAVVAEDQVFQVELPKDGEALHRVARSLAERGINILSLYTEEAEDTMRLVLAVDDTVNAVASLEKLGLSPDYDVLGLGRA